MADNIFFSSKKSPFTVMDLQPNTEYDFTIRAVDNLENFDTWSKHVKFKTLPPLPYISDVTITPIYPASYNADIKFKCSSLATLKSVTIYDNNTSIQMFDNPVIDSEGFITVHVTLLQELTTYNINIRVTDEYNQIGISSIYSYRTTSIPPIISEVKILNRDKYNINVYIDVNSVVGIKNYKYVYNGVTVITEDNPYKCSNLTEDTEYTIEITVYDIYDQTANYTLVARTSGDGPSINNIELTNITINSFDVSVDASPLSDIVQYIYTINNRIYKSENNTYHIEGLTPYTLYTLNVDVYDKFGLYSSKDITFRTKSDGVDINTVTVSDVLYTEFSISITYNKYVEIDKIELLGTDQDGKEYNFGTYNDSSFVVQNVYPNNSYHLKYTITDITGVVTIYEQEERVTMLHSLLNIDDIVVNNVDKYEATISISYTINTPFKYFEVEFEDGTKVNLYTPVYTLQNLKQNTTYNLKVTLVDSFDRKSDPFNVSFKTLINYVYISFSTNEGSNIETIQIEESTSINLDDYTSSRTGYTFNGWYIGDTKYTGNYTVGKEDVTFEAKWTIITYTVTFVYYDEEQGKDVSVDVYADYLQPAIAPTIPSKTGYTFNGWDENITSVTSNFTTNALYTAIEYTIRLSTSGGTTPTQELVFTYDESIGVLPVPELNGATFIEWNTKNDGTGDKITSNMIWKYTNLEIIYAIYVNYSVTYNTNSGELYNKSVIAPIFSMTYNITPESTGTLTSGPSGYILTATTGTKHQLFINNMAGLSNQVIVLLYEFVNTSVSVSRMWYEYNNSSEIIEMNPYTITYMPEILENDSGKIYLEITVPNIGEYIINNLALYQLAKINNNIIKYIMGISMGQLPYSVKDKNSFISWKTDSGQNVSDDDVYTWNTDITLNANYISNEYTIDFNLNE